MSRERGLVYIFDMESGLADSLTRRILDMHQYLIFRSWDMKLDADKEVAAYGPSLRALIISGSARNINGKKNPIPTIPAAFLASGVPVLAICYGMQYLAHLLGVPVVRCWDEPLPINRTKATAKTDKGEQGVVTFQRQADSVLFRGLGTEFPVWMKHNWMLGDVPPDWTVTGRTDKCPIAAMERGNLFALQFHPEPANSLYGRIIIHNFLSFACGLKTPYF